MTPSPAGGSESGSLLCCGLCQIKMYKRNFFRGLFPLQRRPQASLRKSEPERERGAESAECSRARHGVREALETNLRDKSYLGLSPSISLNPSQRSQCNVHCRKSSVLSFGDVDSREVHRMMKFINRSKVQSDGCVRSNMNSNITCSHEDFLSWPNILHLQIHINICTRSHFSSRLQN